MATKMVAVVPEAGGGGPLGIERRGKTVRAGVVQPLVACTVVDRRLVFVSGQVPMIDGKPSGDDIAAQTHATIDRVEQILREAGAGLDHVVKVTAWLARREDFAGFNAAFAERFGHCPPARSTVVCGLVPPVMVEIEAVAVLG